MRTYLFELPIMQGDALFFSAKKHGHISSHCSHLASSVTTNSAVLAAMFLCKSYQKVRSFGALRCVLKNSMSQRCSFACAAAGISYGILSVSWNPSQEGSALGWKEAQANWPVFWELLRNGGKSSKRSR
jgi:hypothetical protein